MTSITAANSIITITVGKVFTGPFQLEGFASDEVFDTEGMEIVEVLMGVDGNLSGGYVNVPLKTTFSLQADSPSCPFFDAWATQQKAAQDVFVASGNITLPSIGLAYNLVKGFFTNWKPVTDAKKLLQPRKFQVTWQTLQPQPV